MKKRWISVLAAGCVALTACEPEAPPSAPAPPAPPTIDLASADPQIAAAIEHAKAAVLAEPQSARKWGALGSALMIHKFHSEALVCLATAESLEPEEPRWPYLQGVILLSWDLEAALPKLERGAKLTGDTPPAPKLRLADALLECGQFERAEKHLQSVAAQHPAEPRVSLGLGRLALARGQFETALQHLERSAASPTTARASFALLAGIQQRLGDTTKAAAASRKLAGLPREPALTDPFFGETAALQTGMHAALTRADRLFRSGRKTEGLALLEKTVVIYPDSATSWRVLGQGRLNAGDHHGAEKALQQALKLAPDESAIHFQLGTVLLARDQYAAAAESFRRAVELWPAYAPSHHQLGLCLAAAGQPSGALEAFQTAIQYDPAFAAAYRSLGGALQVEHRLEEAIAALERAVKLAPSDREAVRLLDTARRNARAGP